MTTYVEQWDAFRQAGYTPDEMLAVAEEGFNGLTYARLGQAIMDELAKPMPNNVSDLTKKTIAAWLEHVYQTTKTKT